MSIAQKITKIQALRQHQRFLYALLFAGLSCLILAVFLSFRALSEVKRLPPPTPRQNDVQLIQDWMTIHYVARKYGVPEPVFEEALALDSKELKRLPLRELAKRSSQSTSRYIEHVQTIIVDFQTQHPTPPQP